MNFYFYILTGTKLDPKEKYNVYDLDVKEMSESVSELRKLAQENLTCQVLYMYKVTVEDLDIYLFKKLLQIDTEDTKKPLIASISLA